MALSALLCGCVCDSVFLCVCVFVFVCLPGKLHGAVQPATLVRHAARVDVVYFRVCAMIVVVVVVVVVKVVVRVNVCVYMCLGVVACTVCRRAGKCRSRPHR